MSLTLTLERGGGEVSGSGTNIELDGTIAGGAIESVEMYGDTQQQTYSGKNKLTSISHLVSSDNGITVSLQSDGSIKATGTVGSSWNGFNLAFYNTDTIASGQYTFSIDHSISSAIAVAFRTSDNTNLGNITIPAGSTSATGTISGTIGKSSLWVSANTGTSINFTIKAQLESGSSATSFEPYVGGTASPNPDYPQEVQTVTGRQVVTISDGGSESQEYEVNLGKNLFDLGTNLDNYFVTVSTGTKVYTDNDKSFVTATFSDNKVTFTNYVTTNWRWVSKVVPLEKNTTYTISGDWTSSLRIVGFDSLTSGATGTLIRQINPDAGQYPPATFDSGSYNYVVVSLFPGEGSKYFGSIQIEKGSTATTYAPYFTPIELCKIGTYQDYIYKSGEDWYVHKEIVKISPDGTETWNSLSISNPDYIYCYTSAFDSLVKPKVWNGLFSDKFVVYDYSEGGYEWISPSANIKGACFSNGDNSETINLRIICPKTTADSVGSFKTWLGNTRPVFYYPIKTPTDTQITNEALIAQLEALNEATTYDGTTIITVSSENLAGSLEVTASANIAKTYTEVEIGSPFTITDVEGKSSNTTLDGNVYVDWAYNKKQYSFDLFNLTPQDYADIRAFYDYQFNNSAFPTITVPELNIDKLPVYMEISSRNIINQCLLTDKLTIKFRETVQP